MRKIIYIFTLLFCNISFAQDKYDAIFINFLIREFLLKDYIQIRPMELRVLVILMKTVILI